MFHLKCTEPVLSKDDYIKRSELGHVVCVLAIDTADKDNDAAFASQAISVVDIMNELRAFRQDIKEKTVIFIDNLLEYYSEWILDNDETIYQINKKENAVVKHIEL
ncbi:hypothetical protein J6590_077650 [Homalodisca vitripennis]|nr:hypothetical protein J6590_077650 [Homalodisca vitripennis]